jgi:hypothetical protein
MAKGWRFLEGFMAGAAGALVVVGGALWGLTNSGLIELAEPAAGLPDPGAWLGWAADNLGWSTVVFGVLLAAFVGTLARLERLLAEDAPINRIVQADHLADTWTTLFFGTGVIWTAIGMRSALIYALGDRDVALSSGAFAMLERMIDGGILLALSTTIVGGVGGYLMRVYKTMSIGAELTRRYDQAARADTSCMRESLERIEKHLDGRAARDEEPPS